MHVLSAVGADKAALLDHRQQALFSVRQHMWNVSRWPGGESLLQHDQTPHAASCREVRLSAKGWRNPPHAVVHMKTLRCIDLVTECPYLY